MKKAIITGSSKGIGLTIAKKLLQQGYQVNGFARTLAENFDHPNFFQTKIDLSLVQQLPSFLKQLDLKPDVVICNAGKGQFGHLEEFSYEQIKDLMNLNFLSQVYFVKAFLPYFKKEQNKDIIFIGSEAALAGKRKGTVYCASKFALRGFVQALREECAQDNIRVTLINPGMVQTSFFEQLHFQPAEEASSSLLPENIADLVHFILNSPKNCHFDEINLSPQKKMIKFLKK